MSSKFALTFILTSLNYFASAQQKNLDSMYYEQFKRNITNSKNLEEIQNRLSELQRKNSTDSFRIVVMKDSTAYYKKMVKEDGLKAKSLIDSVKSFNEKNNKAVKRQSEINLNISNIKTELIQIEKDSKKSDAGFKTIESLKTQIQLQKTYKSESLSKINTVLNEKRQKIQEASKYKDDYLKYEILVVGVYLQKVQILFQNEYKPEDVKKLLKESDDIINNPYLSKEQTSQILPYVNSLRGYCKILNDVFKAIYESDQQIKKNNRAGAYSKLIEKATDFDDSFSYIINELKRLAELAKTLPDIKVVSKIQPQKCN